MVLITSRVPTTAEVEPNVRLESLRLVKLLASILHESCHRPHEK